MSPARIKPGTIGRIEWDESRTPGKVRGTVRTRDGADKPRRLVAVRDTRDEVEAELKARAAALLYRSDIWSADTTLSEAIERWIATLGDPDEGGAQAPMLTARLSVSRSARRIFLDGGGTSRAGFTGIAGPKRGPQLRLAIELGLATGCRIGEVCGFLMPEASDVPSPRIGVTGTVITVEGKTRRANELKGDEQARILELPAWVRPIIDECRAIARRTGPDAPLLQGSRGGLQTPANLGTRLRSLRDEYRRELEAVGVNVDEFTFHTLRRTVLTAVDEVAGRTYSQAQAGHADERTTAGYIATPRSLPIITGAVAAIQRSFGGAS